MGGGRGSFQSCGLKPYPKIFAEASDQECPKSKPKPLATFLLLKLFGGAKLV